MTALGEGERDTRGRETREEATEIDMADNDKGLKETRQLGWGRMNPRKLQKQSQDDPVVFEHGSGNGCLAQFPLTVCKVLNTEQIHWYNQTYSTSCKNKQVTRKDKWLLGPALLSQRCLKLDLDKPPPLLLITSFPCSWVPPQQCLVSC
jgi:hypothetical protein